MIGEKPPGRENQPPDHKPFYLSLEIVGDLIDLAENGYGTFQEAGTYNLPDIDPEWLPDFHTLNLETSRQKVNCLIYPNGLVEGFEQSIDGRRFKVSFDQSVENGELTEYNRTIYFTFDNPNTIPATLRPLQLTRVYGYIGHSLAQSEGTLQLTFADGYQLVWNAFIDYRGTSIHHSFYAPTDPHENISLEHIMPLSLRPPKVQAEIAEAQRHFKLMNLAFEEEDNNRVVKIGVGDWEIKMSVKDPREVAFKGLVRAIEGGDEAVALPPLLLPFVIEEVKKES